MNFKNNNRSKAIVCLVCLFIVASIFLPVLLTSGSTAGIVESSKAGNMAILYGCLALFSFLLLMGYLLLEKNKEIHFAILFACVTASNGGYFLQAISPSLTGALMANRLSYLGSAYSVLVMLLIILEVCQIRRAKKLSGLLVGITPPHFCSPPAATGWGCTIKRYPSRPSTV